MLEKFFLIIKIATGIVLLACFTLNSWAIFKNYVDGNTVTSTNIEINIRGKQILPAIVICREKAYDSVRYMSKLEDFLDNTMQLSYHFLDDNGNFINKDSTALKQEHVYSIGLGHCMVLKYKREVRVNAFALYLCACECCTTLI